MLRRAGCRSPRFALLCCCLLAAMGCCGVGAKRKGRRVSNAAARKVRSAAPPLGKKEEAAARGAFRLMDIDGSGMISEAEMKAATKATSKTPFNYGTWTVMDADADGEVSMSEFLSAFALGAKGVDLEKERDRRERAKMFDAVDADKDEAISGDEMDMVLKTMGTVANPGEVQKALKALDVDSDGKVSKAEFVTMDGVNPSNPVDRIARSIESLAQPPPPPPPPPVFRGHCNDFATEPSVSSCLSCSGPQMEDCSRAICATGYSHNLRDQTSPAPSVLRACAPNPSPPPNGRSEDRLQQYLGVFQRLGELATEPWPDRGGRNITTGVRMPWWLGAQASEWAGLMAEDEKQRLAWIFAAEQTPRGEYMVKEFIHWLSRMRNRLFITPVWSAPALVLLELRELPSVLEEEWEAAVDEVQQLATLSTKNPKLKWDYYKGTHHLKKSQFEALTNRVHESPLALLDVFEQRGVFTFDLDQLSKKWKLTPKLLKDALRRNDVIVKLNRTLAAASDLLTTRTGQLTIERARAKGLGAAGAEFVQEAVAHPSACPCAADGLPVAVEETPSVARAAEEEYMNVSVQLTNQEYLDEVMRCTLLPNAPTIFTLQHRQQH